MKAISTAELPVADFPLPPQHPRPPPSTQMKKKTRELPNLSNCHCCNRRVNCTNPKNRLRTLTSEWRIVLLCNSCYNFVESSKFCSYCLTNISSSSADSLFECKRCHHRIHRDCVSMFSFGSGNGGDLTDFSICFDCWVPKLLENDYGRVCESRPRKRAKKEAKICGDSISLESSRVCDSQYKGKSLEDVVNEANVAAQKKVAAAAEAKEKAVAKAAVARRAVELSGGALNFVSVDMGGCNHGGAVVDDDAQLAIQLHRAMNSSPRISRNSCLLNTSHVNLSMVNGNANSETLLLRKEDKTCVSKAVDVGSEANIVNVDSSSRRQQSGSCSIETGKDFVRKSDETKNKKSNMASDLNDCLITYSRKKRASQYGRSKEEYAGLLRMYRRRLSHVERRNAERDHCLKTYSRRLSLMSHCKNKLVDAGFSLQHGILAPALALNCCEKPRVFADAS